MVPQLKRLLGDARRELRTEGLRLIMAAAAAFSGFHADLATLAHEDPEQDVAQNLTHIQLHRRIKALRRLAELAAGLAPSTLRHILFPVVWFSAIEPAEQDRMKKTEGAYNLSDEVGSPSPNLSLSLSLALSRSLALAFSSPLLEPDCAASGRLFARPAPSPKRSRGATTLCSSTARCASSVSGSPTRRCAVQRAPPLLSK